MNERLSYRTILRSSAIVALSSMSNIVAGIIRMKVAAVLLGPAGVGLIGLYQGLVETAATVSGLGLGGAGTRQIAAAQAEGGTSLVSRVRRALFWGTMVAAVVGATVVWLLRDLLAARLLGLPGHGSEVGWLAVGVGLTVAAASQTALLSGLRRIRDLAWLQVTAGLSGAVLGTLALWLWREDGILAMVLIPSAAVFLLGHLRVARLGPPEGPPEPVRRLAREWRRLLGLGLAFMLAALLTQGGILAIRGLTLHTLGGVALGQFQAAWSIGALYLGFVLGAMATDYYPRLTEAIRDRARAVRLVNEQAEVALLLCGPVVLAMLACAPWVIHLLYSAEFALATDILRWQLLGDILKVVSWPLGFVIVAQGRGTVFLVTEAVAMGIFVAGVALGLPRFGVQATGIAFLACYAVYLPVVALVANRLIGFRFEPGLVRHALLLLAAAGTVSALARISDGLSAAVGLGLALAAGLHALVQLAHKAGLEGRAGRLAAASRRLLNLRGPET